MGYSRYGPVGPAYYEREEKLPFALWLLRRGRALWLVLIVLILWGLSGFYVVGPDAQGVVKRFGKHIATTGPGIHYHLPWPIESVVKVAVTEVRRAEIGFRTAEHRKGDNQPRYQEVPEEATMLTGDENIVVAETIVQYKVSDAAAFAFNVANPDETVRMAAQAALRQVIGSHAIDDALTTGKATIQEEVRVIVQEILDRYDAGIQVLAVQLQDVHPPDPVIAAFQDVASAKEDQARIVNQAEAYANEVIPKARGEAVALIQEAEAYRQARIARAQGDAERFRMMVQAYRQAPEVTRTRMYLETLETILPRMRKVIVDADDPGLLKLLDLSEIAGKEVRS